MTFDEFVKIVAKQLFVYRYAQATDRSVPADEEPDGRVRSARTRMRNARRLIDDAVLEYVRQVVHDRKRELFAELYSRARTTRLETPLGTTTGRLVVESPLVEKRPRFEPRLMPGSIDRDEEPGTGGTSSGNRS